VDTFTSFLLHHQLHLELMGAPLDEAAIMASFSTVLEMSENIVWLPHCSSDDPEEDSL